MTLNLSLLFSGWSAIVTTGNLTSSTPTKRVLVVGAAGGVGTFAVQLLKAWNHEVKTKLLNKDLTLRKSKQIKIDDITM